MQPNCSYKCNQLMLFHRILCHFCKTCPYITTHDIHKEVIRHLVYLIAAYYGACRDATCSKTQTTPWGQKYNQFFLSFSSNCKKTKNKKQKTKSKKKFKRRWICLRIAEFIQMRL